MIHVRYQNIVGTFFFPVCLIKGKIALIQYGNIKCGNHFSQFSKGPFHHFDLLCSHFHLTLMRSSLISNQRHLIHCKSIDNIQLSKHRELMGSSHFKEYICRPVISSIKTQAERQSVPWHFNCFSLGLLNICTAENGIERGGDISEIKTEKKAAFCGKFS